MNRSPSSNVVNIIAETDHLIRDGYFQLRVECLLKEQIQKLEDFLSNEIYTSEELIQSSKGIENPELVNEYYRRRTILKRLADGLAWKIFNMDSRFISVYSIGNPPGFMAGKIGYQFERNVVKALYTLPNISVAIQCDITNILRTGDILARMTNGSYVPVEVKGSISGRSQRQKKRMKEIVDFFETGRYKKVIDGYAPLRALSVPVVFEHYWVELESISKQATKTYIAGQFLNEAVLLIVFQPEKIQQEMINEFVGSFKLGKGTLTISSLGRHMNRYMEISPRSRLPLTIFPINSDLGIQFVLGKLEAIIALNKERVLDKLRTRGLECQLQEDGIAIITTLKGIKFEIRDAWDKILNEMVSVTSFVEYVYQTTILMDKEYSVGR